MNDFRFPKEEKESKICALGGYCLYECGML